MSTETAPMDASTLREDFPLLTRRVYGKPLVYLDNAATTHKPEVVLAAIDCFYRLRNSNVHRGVHRLSQDATDAYEGARASIARHINANETEEIIFVRGTTEAINLVAQSYGHTHLEEGDEILLTRMEHHSNIVPWQLLCQQTGATLRVAQIQDDGALDMASFDRLCTERTKVVSCVHISNALGTINPIKQIIDRAHSVGAIAVVDGAQAIPHAQVDVQALDADFYAFSGHKAYGPTGIGVLYGKRSVMETLRPYQGGGDMIRSVSFEGTSYADIPFRFEAGTPNIAGAVGLEAALDYLSEIGLDAIAAHESALLAYATEKLSAMPGMRLIGTAPEKAGVLSFVMEDAHPHDIGTILDREGIAIRTGHHCAQPVMERFKIPATARASLGLYNTRADIDALVEGLARVQEVLG